MYISTNKLAARAVMLIPIETAPLEDPLAPSSVSVLPKQLVPGLLPKLPEAPPAKLPLA